MSSQTTNNPTKKSFSDDSIPLIWKRRPALRSFYLEWVLLFALIAAYFYVSYFLGWLYESPLMQYRQAVVFIYQWIDTALFFLMFLVVIRVIWIMFSHHYYLYSNRIETRKYLIFQRQDTVDLSHIRSTEVRRSLLERIIGVGELKIATSATADAEVLMPRISMPVRVRNQINAARSEHLRING